MPARPFQIEAWTEYGIGLLILFSRIACRTRLVGWNWDGDDCFAVAAIFFLTGECVMLELIGRWGSIVGITDEIALSLSEAQKQHMIKGAKCNIAGWCLYVTLIWCLKACMLFLYRRLTLETRQKRLVLFAAVACVCSYLATIFVILLRCQPFHKNWQVYPYPGDSCASPNQIFLTLVITNVSTDLIILYIPLPLLWIVKMPLTRKLVYGLWLTTGVFIIVASLLRCILSIRDANQINVSTIWAIRETFVGIIAVNAPILGPWLVKKGTSIAQSVSSRDQSRSAANAPSSTIITIGQQSLRLERLKKDGKGQKHPGWTTINDSQEFVIEKRESTGNAAPSINAASSNAASSNASYGEV